MTAVSCNRTHRPGNTLVELLLVIAVVAILAGFTLVALNPQTNLDDAKDAQREHDLRTMVDALYQYQIKNNKFPQVPTYATVDEQHRDVCTKTKGNLFLCEFVAAPDPERLPLGPLIPDYLAELPFDPAQPGDQENCGLDFNTIAEDCSTGYQLWLDDAGRIHAFAPLGNDGNGIEVAR